MSRTRRIAWLTFLVVLGAATAAVSQIPLKVHSFELDAGSATVCTDGATFNGTPTAASAVGIVMTSQVFNQAGTVLLATGNTHTFGAMGEIFTFTVTYAPGTVNPGDFVILSVTNQPGNLAGTEGDTVSAVVANCSISVPATPPWALALLLVLILAAGAGWTARGRVGSGAGRLASLALLAAVALGAAPGGASIGPPVFTKVFSPDTVGPNGTSMLIFTIDNSAHGVPVDLLAFDDEFPVGLSFAAPAFVSNSCLGTLELDEDDADSGFDVRLTAGKVGANQTCQIVVNVTGTAIDNSNTDLENTSGPLTSDAGSSGSASDTLMVRINRPGFTKSFAPSTVEFGKVSTLTFVIDNSLNASSAFFLSFTDTLPPGMVVADPPNDATDCTFLSTPTVDAEPGSDSISLSLGSVAEGATCEVAVDVVAGAIGSLGNVSGELFSGLPPTLTSGKAAAVLEVTGFEQLLVLEKTFTDDPVPPGGTVNLRFKVTNKSRDSAATGITFDDVIDPLGSLAGLVPTLPPTPDPPCGAGSTLTFGSGTLTLAGGTLPAEGTCTFDVKLAVPAGAAPGSYPNTTTAVSGTIDGEPETGNVAGDILSIVAFPILTKEFTDDPVGAGDTVTLEFTITDTSGVGATNISFFDVFSEVLPTADEVAGTAVSNKALPTMVADCCGMGSSCSFEPLLDPAGGGGGFSSTPARFDLTGGSLSAGGSCTFSVVLDVLAGAGGGVYPNTSSRITANVGMSTVTGKRARDSLVVVGAPQLAKVFTNDPVAPGGTVTLEFTLEHDASAPADATGVTFTDDLAALVPAVPGLMATGLPLTGLCGAGDGTLAGSAGDTLLTFSGATLTPGEVCTFSVDLSVPAGATPGVKSNTTSEVSATVDGVVAKSAKAQDSFLISGFRVLKEFTDDPVIAGDTANLRFTLDNTMGTAAVTTISFQDDLDAVIDGMTATAGPAAPCGGTLLGIGSGLITFSSASTLAAGTSCFFDVTVQVPATSGMPAVPTPDDGYPNATTAPVATVGGSTISLDPAVDTLEVDSTFLALTKEFTNDPVAPGGSVNLLFTLTNLSSSATVTDIAFDDNLGAVLTGLVATGAINDCGGMSPTIFPSSLFTFTGGTLTPGASCSVTVAVDVPDAPLASPGPYINTTSGVTGKVGALDVFGDPAEDELLIQLLAIAKAFLDDPTGPGGSVTLQFTLTNLGGDPAVDLAFTDDLAAALSGLQATALPPDGVCGTGSALTGTSFLTFTGGSLAGGSSCTFSATLAVPGTAPDGTFLNTTSKLREQGVPVAPAAKDFLVIVPPPVFSKQFVPDSIGLTFTSKLTFTIDNTANTVGASDIDFLDMLPVGVQVAAAPNVQNTCGGDVVAAASSVSISLSNGSVPAGTTCTLSVDVTVTALGSFVNTTSDLTSSLGNSGKATDTLNGIGCTALNGTNFTLINRVIPGIELFEACNTLTVGPHVQVLGPSGDLTLRGGVAVVLNNGIEFGGLLTIEINPGLIP